MAVFQFRILPGFIRLAPEIPSGFQRMHSRTLGSKLVRIGYMILATDNTINTAVKHSLDHILMAGNEVVLAVAGQLHKIGGITCNAYH
jgi:hypothetical protein